MKHQFPVLYHEDRMAMAEDRLEDAECYKSHCLTAGNRSCCSRVGGLEDDFEELEDHISNSHSRLPNNNNQASSPSANNSKMCSSSSTNSTKSHSSNNNNNHLHQCLSEDPCLRIFSKESTDRSHNYGTYPSDYGGKNPFFTNHLLFEHIRKLRLWRQEKGGTPCS